MIETFDIEGIDIEEIKTDTKTARIQLRCTPQEAEAIKEKARSAGLTVSDFLRAAAFNTKIRAPVPDDIRRNISRWSQNLNQLAYHANRCGQVEAREVARLRADAQAILQAISATIEKH